MFSIANILILIQQGLAAGEAIKAAIDAGKIRVSDPANPDVALSAIDANAKIDAALAQDLATGDSAAQRLEDAHRDDPPAAPPADGGSPPQAT